MPTPKESNQSQNKGGVGKTFANIIVQEIAKKALNPTTLVVGVIIIIVIATLVVILSGVAPGAPSQSLTPTPAP